MAFPAYAKLAFEGFKQTPKSAVRRTEMEGGPPKQYKRLSRVMIERPVGYYFDSKTDYNNFMTWFNTDISRGAAWFDWTDPYDNVVKQARIKDGLLDPRPINKTLTMWMVKFTIETWSA